MSRYERSSYSSSRPYSSSLAATRTSSFDSGLSSARTTRSSSTYSTTDPYSGRSYSQRTSSSPYGVDYSSRTYQTSSTYQSPSSYQSTSYQSSSKPSSSGSYTGSTRTYSADRSSRVHDYQTTSVRPSSHDVSPATRTSDYGRSDYVSRTRASSLRDSDQNETSRSVISRSASAKDAAPSASMAARERRAAARRLLESDSTDDGKVDRGATKRSPRSKNDLSPRSKKDDEKKDSTVTSTKSPHSTYYRRRAQTSDLSYLKSPEPEVAAGSKMTYGQEGDRQESRSDRIARYKEDRRQQLTGRRDRILSSTDDDDEFVSRMRASLKNKRGERRQIAASVGTDSSGDAATTKRRSASTTSATTTATRPTTTVLRSSSAKTATTSRGADTTSASSRLIRRPESALALETGRPMTEETRRPASVMGSGADHLHSDSASSVTSRSSRSDRRRFIRRQNTDPTSPTPTKSHREAVNGGVKADDKSDVDSVRKSSLCDLSNELDNIGADLEARIKRRRDKTAKRKSSVNLINRTDSTEGPSATTDEVQDSTTSTLNVIHVSKSESSKPSSTQPPTSSTSVTSPGDSTYTEPSPVHVNVTPGSVTPDSVTHVTHDGVTSVRAHTDDSSDVYFSSSELVESKPADETRDAKQDRPQSSILKRSDSKELAKEKRPEPVSILKKRDDAIGDPDRAEVVPILKKRDSEEIAVVEEKRASEGDIKPILKKTDGDSKPNSAGSSRRGSAELHSGILKHSSENIPLEANCDGELRPILKRDSVSYGEVTLSGVCLEESGTETIEPVVREIKPILKKDPHVVHGEVALSGVCLQESTTDKGEAAVRDIKPILKKDVVVTHGEIVLSGVCADESTTDSSAMKEIRPILKKDPSMTLEFGKDKEEVDVGVKSPPSQQQRLVSILKRRDSEPIKASESELSVARINLDDVDSKRHLTETDVKPILKTSPKRGRSGSLRDASAGWRSFEKESSPLIRTPGKPAPAYCPQIGSQAEMKDEKLLRLLEERKRREEGSSEDDLGRKPEMIKAEEEIKREREFAVAIDDDELAKEMSVQERISLMEKLDAEKENENVNKTKPATTTSAITRRPCETRPVLSPANAPATTPTHPYYAPTPAHPDIIDTAKAPVGGVGVITDDSNNDRTQRRFIRKLERSDSSDIDSLLYKDNTEEIMLSDREIEEAEREFDKLFDLSFQDEHEDFNELAIKAKQMISVKSADNSTLMNSRPLECQPTEPNVSQYRHELSIMKVEPKLAVSSPQSGVSLGVDESILAAVRACDSLESADSSTPAGEDIVKPDVAVSARISQFSRCEQRRLNKKKRDRSRTAPVNVDALNEARKLTSTSSSDQSSNERRSSLDAADGGENKIQDVMTEIRELQEREGDEAQDDKTKLTLAQKMALFSEKKDEEKPATKNVGVARRKQRRQASRFKTQPVTYDEVEKAAKISPLAMSMVKPPEPELLAGMPISAQRDIIASHAKTVLETSINNRRDSNKGPAGSDTKPVQKKFTVPSTTGPPANFRQDLKAGIEELRKREGSSEKSPSPEIKVTKPSDGAGEPGVTSPGRSGAPSVGAPTPRRVEESSDTSENEVVVRRRVRPAAHTRTQPITNAERADLDNNSSDGDAMAKLSIAERVALLRKSGHEDWKKRVGKDDEDSLTPPDALPRDRLKKQRPKSIHELKSQLEDNQSGWKVRVEKKDTAQFTAEGKRCLSGPSSPEVENSPLMNYKRRSPKAAVISLSESPGSGPMTPVSPKTPTATATAATAAAPPTVSSGSNSAANTTSSDLSDVEKANVIAVPQQDDLDFFGSTSQSDLDNQKIQVDDAAFDDVFLMSQDTLETTRRLKPKRQHKARSKNPMRALKNRTDLKENYTEVKNEEAQKQIHKVKLEKIGATKTGLAESALAGLASTEKITSVELRAVDASTPARRSGADFDNYKEVMLIQVKGRRNVQVRLVEPLTRSLCSGDCFVLVTTDKIFCWIGKYCNVLEKAKAQEIANLIFQKKDLGFRGERPVVFIDEVNSQYKQEFWSLLGGYGTYRSAGPENEDNIYETNITESNTVYEVQGDNLVPVEEGWGQPLKYTLLHQTKVLLFDFGAELYVWNGQKCSFDSRKMGLKLAKHIHQKGYDYEELGFNPMSPFLSESDGGAPLKADKRPDWCILGKMNYNMETQLFKDKFVDWPDSSKIIRVKPQDSTDQKTALEPLKAFDASEMLKPSRQPVTLQLEGTHVGRGRKWVDHVDQVIKKEFDVVTIKVTCWHVLEYDHYILDDDNHGQFHDGDTYVVRWQYMVMSAGLKTLRGAAARQSLTGRERCAYFFWQGTNSTVNEKGASALMTVELDEERGPQVRVVQGVEPPCFTQLFDGRMMIHIGKREDESTNTPGPWKLYILRNEISYESYLLEIACLYENLRSRSSFLLMNVNTGDAYVWHGAKSPETSRQCLMEKAQYLSQMICPLELGLKTKDGSLKTPKELVEGKESREFLSALNSQASSFESLLNARIDDEHSPRLFYMTSVSGTFEAIEVLNPCRCPDIVSPLPFTQEQLYDVSHQPGLYLVDFGTEIYLWQGYWPEGFEEGENVQTGSARARFNRDRKLALQTTLDYCKQKNESAEPRAELVIAGHESKHFINLFPAWTVNEEARECNLAEFERLRGRLDVRDVLSLYEKKHYTLRELQEQPMLEGVDPSKIESYLIDEEFQGLMGMDKESFYKLAPWKQIEMKKMVGLF